MSDDNSDTPLDFPTSETEHYPELVENSARPKKTPHIWTPEILEIMERVGCSPDMDDSSEEESQSELKDFDKRGELVHFKLQYHASADATTAANQPALHAWPAENFKIKLPALKPSSKAGIAAPQATKPSHQGCKDALVDEKTRAATTGSVKLKKRQVDFEESENSNTDLDKDAEATKKKKHSKKKARLTSVGPPDAGNNLEEQPLARRKRGRPRKPIEDKTLMSTAVPGFNASVFVSVENPPKLMRGKTYKTDKHVAQDPRVEGPFTLIRSMKWEDFLDEVAGWVGVDKENLRINGLSWGFQKQKARLPLTSEQAFKTLREQVKVKNGSATVIFVYHPICKQPQNRGQQDAVDWDPVHGEQEDETRWGKKLSLDDKLAPIIVQLETLYEVGQCSEHPDIHCFYTSVRPNKSWHFELNKARLSVWANAINRKEVDYQRAPIGRTFFGAKDRIQSKNSSTIFQAVPQTPPPPHLQVGDNSFVPPALHTYAWPPFYSGSQQGAHVSPNPILASPGPHHNYPPSPYYPFSSPFGYGNPVPWGYPTTSPQTPRPKDIPPTCAPTDVPQIRVPQLPGGSGPSAIPADPIPLPDLKVWCREHNLGEAEYDGLLKLGFRVGDGHELANLERPIWEWAGIAPLAQMRILAACGTTSSN